MRSMFHSKRDLALYEYALHCALATLIGFAAAQGRGWYHYVDQDLIAVSEIVL
jgi:hypothetical protein